LDVLGLYFPDDMDGPIAILHTATQRDHPDQFRQYPDASRIMLDLLA
jgi:hypothetical protein